MLLKPAFSRLLFLSVLLAGTSAVFGQTTAFTYQGSLSSGGTAANGHYDFQFTLFDALTAGNQIGSTVNKTNVAVSGGLFAVSLDFGAAAFLGADRYLEISAKKTTDSTFTTLTPRQPIASTPYAIQTLNAAQLGGVAASQFVQTTDSRLSDARPAGSVNFNTATLSNNLSVTNGGTGLGSSGASGNFLRSNGSIWTSAPLSASDIPGGSGNYIRNTTTPQTASFNVSGSGTVGGSFGAAQISSSGTTNLIFLGQSSSTIGSWLRLNNTSTGGHSWNIISTGSGNGEGAGKLLFNDQTSGGTLMQLDGSGLTVAGNNAVNGNSTVGGNLTVNGTLNATVTTSNFAALPNCKARQTSAQTFSSGSTINVRFDDTQFCTGVTFDNTNDRLVILTSGVYQVSAEIIFVANNSGLRYFEINSSNGGEAAAASINAVTGFDTQMNATALVRLNAGDVIALAAAQTSGGNLNTSVFNGRGASLSINWVSP